MSENEGAYTVSTLIGGTLIAILVLLFAAYFAPVQEDSQICAVGVHDCENNVSYCAFEADVDDVINVVVLSDGCCEGVSIGSD